MLVYTIIDKDIHNQTNVDGTAMNTIDLIVFIKEQHNCWKIYRSLRRSQHPKKQN